MRRVIMLLGGLALCVVVGMSCAKKTTKVDATPDAPPPPPPPPVEQTFTPKDDDQFKPVDMDALARQVLVTLYFDYDRYELKPESIEKLEKIAKFLMENKSVRVLIEGHADERGSSEYNVALGENRSKSAREYLTTYGVEATRVETTSYGRERPANPNCTDEACHSKNRRVEWKVLAK